MAAATASILVVDDDRFLQERLVRLLQDEGYESEGVGSGEEALARLETHRPDLVVLDLGLPGMDGLTTCRRIRKRWRMPVLMLTARNDAADKALGLETGADDYLAKPFEPIEFIARVRAQIRRFHEYRAEPETAPSSAFTLGDLRIDYDKREVSLGERVLELTTREYEVLAYLSRNRDRAVSREQLFEHVWGFEMEFTTNSLDVHMYRIRKKLEANPDRPRYLHTIRGFGYKLTLDP
jgi:DNA-binding response OmpR family regulator